MQDGSSGLVIMGGHSSSESCGFESLHIVLDVHFSHQFVAKFVMFVWKRITINGKRGWDGPFEKAYSYEIHHVVGASFPDLSKTQLRFVKLLRCKSSPCLVDSSSPSILGPLFQTVWPEKIAKLSIKVAQKWFQ